MTQYHQHQFFVPVDEKEHERGNRGHDVFDRCENCGHGFMEHYNGRCPKDESADTG